MMAKKNKNMFIDLNEGHEGRVMTEEIDSPGDSSSR